MKLFGNIKLEGGFEMQSKHDILTAAITLSVLAVTVILALTNHLTGGLQTACLTGLGMVFVYWFTRGGSLMGGNNVPSNPVPDATQIAAEAATAVLNTLGQSPATGGSPNAGNVTGSGGN